MIRFAEAFPDERIVHALRAQLSWTHFKSVIYLDDPLKRDFYAEMCRVERWSTRTLQARIDSMLFEVISRSTGSIMREPETFRLELGSGFSFVARQKRITVGHQDYYNDLLFLSPPAPADCDRTQAG